MGRRKKSGYSVEDGALIMCSIMLFFMIITLFVARWRVDQWGTYNLKQIYNWGKFSGWESRSYGLLHVSGTFRQSWTTLTTQACDARNVGGIATVGSGFVSWLTGKSNGEPTPEGGETCKDNSACNKGFMAHMATRCLEYENISKFSTALLGTSIICMLLCMVAIILGFMSKRSKYGGVTTGLLVFSGTISLILDICWALVTDASFKTIMMSAWFPYPELGICWFLHVYAASVIFLCGLLYGWCVLPDVMGYDHDAKKINRHKKRLNFLRARRIREEVVAERQPAPAPCAFPVYPVCNMAQPIPMMMTPKPMEPMPQRIGVVVASGPHPAHHQAETFGVGTGPQAVPPQAGAQAFSGADPTPHYEMPPIACNGNSHNGQGFDHGTFGAGHGHGDGHGYDNASGDAGGRQADSGAAHGLTPAF